MRVLQVVLNEFVTDARVLRAARLAAEMGCESTVFALGDPTLPAREQLGPVDVRRFKLLTRPLPKAKPVQLIKFAEANCRMVAAGIRLRPNLVHANDLTGLPIGAAIARATGARLLYDSHELWCDPSYAAVWARWLFRAGLSLERFLARRSDGVITVSDGLADEMVRHLGIERPRLIRNIPDLSAAQDGPDRPIRNWLRIGEDVPVLLHQGWVHEGRGLTQLIDAMRCIRDRRAVLVILGDGYLVSKLEEQVAQAGLERRVFFHEAVPPLELPFWTRDADLGICATEDTHLSFRLSLPNKLFEYIHAGAPVICSDLPETSKVVTEHAVGRCFRSGDASDLVRVLDELLGSPALVRELRENVRRAAPLLSWDHEGHKLRVIYETLLGLGVGRVAAIA